MMTLSDASVAYANSVGTRSLSTGTASADWDTPATKVTPVRIRPEPAAPDFDVVYGRWFESVLRWVAAMGVRHADKFDVAQNVFVVVQRRLKDCDGRNVPAWLFTITARQARDYRRQLWNATYFNEAAQTVDKAPASTAMSALHFEAWERSDLLKELLGNLTPEMRNALVLQFHGFSCDEIAAMEGVPANTVWSRLSRARKRLAQLATPPAYRRRTRAPKRG